MYKYIATLLLAVLSSYGCNKFLETTPQSFLSPSEYYTSDNITSALAGVYNPLFNSYVYGNYYYSSLQACTDENFYGGSGRTLTTGLEVYSFDYGNANLNGYWTTLYTGIERANELMKYVDPTDTSATMKAAYGEALFLRGYYYYMLVTYFGGVPLKLTATDDADSLSVARSTVKEVYDQIVSDMTTAEDMVYTASELGYSSRVSKTTVEGILARVCLSMAGEPLNDASQYANALSWATKVKASGIHSLNTSYKQVFINEAADVYDIAECMWEADFSGNNSTTQTAAGRNGNVNGIPFTSSATYTSGGTDYLYQDTGYCYGFEWVTKKLFDLYDVYDARRNWNIGSFSYVVNTSYSSPAVYRTVLTGDFVYNRPVAKWRRNYETVYPKNKNYTPINFPILRYSDVLLMLAEAELQVNGVTQTALDAINAVRERGYGISGSTAPAKSLTLLTSGSGYTATFELGDDNLGTGIGYTATVSSGAVTALTLKSGGLGFTDGQVVTIGAAWYSDYYYAASTQVVYDGNLYTVAAAGISSSVPPTNTSGSSDASSTGVSFKYAGVAATAQVAVATVADVDLTTLTLEDIQDERSRELCFEALRIPDLLRWGNFIANMKAVATQMAAQTTFSTNTQTQASLGYNNIADRNTLWPIPSSEMTTNKLATQNTGW
ncbi:MAG: RagB/SusD family nutrient uptake outer membrane protein [Chitinophagaceae bacterium]